MDIEKMSTYEIEEYLKEKRHTAFILWQVEDITNQAEIMGVENFSTQDAEEVINALNGNIDCEYGITWETIAHEIQSLFSNLDL